jgi:hypothetical protein
MKTAGITIERNARGEAAYIRIDLRKYGRQLMPFLKETGVEIDAEASQYDPEFVAKIRRSEEQIAAGKCKVIKTEDLWK